ncbi:MAG: hypothetical protein Q9163_004580 [Psora crenata]
MLLNNRKRTHDDDEDDIVAAPERKRIQSMNLPFRAFPTVQHTRLFSQLKRQTPKPLFTQTITPTDSEDEISPALGPNAIMKKRHKSPFSTGGGQALMELPDHVMDLSSPPQPHVAQRSDMDSMMLSPEESSCSLLPRQVDTPAVRDATGGGRLPTPIYGHFQQSAPSNSDSNAQTAAQMGRPFEMEYENHIRARRLPTPISEDESMDVFADPLSDHDKEMSDLPHNRWRGPARSTPPVAYQSSKRRKPTFSMGIRADCDRCKNRVPGHYNHIFRD